jgi:hypothetical protein
MHPRATRRRPLLYFGRKGFNVYLNNVDSPGFGRPIIGVFIPELKSKNHVEKFWADAVRCFKVTPQCSFKHFCSSCFDLDCFVVEFWDEKRIEPNSLYSVEIYAPSQWGSAFLLNIIDESIQQNSIVSILNTYCINGIDFPFNTINTIHHEFKRHLSN